jgi:uncharacterized protein (TIGR01777 family)
MRIFLTGGTGLIGRNLARRLLDKGHTPVILSRHSDEMRRKPEMRVYQFVQGDPATAGRWQHELDGCDVVVNLAGHNLFAERWSAAVKHKIRDSRVHATQHVVAAIGQARKRPQALVQASAIGYYGPHGDEELTESSPSGSDFLAVVCREWEEASDPVEALGVRRAIMRTGIVLASGEGALGAMALPFKIGPGMPIGSGGKFGLATGEQWMSWIHLDDIVGLFLLAIENAEASGPINGTAPNPVRNAEFSRALSNVLWKPTAPWRVFMPVGLMPDPIFKLLLGEVADVITSGQKVLPTRAQALGYHYNYPELVEALRAALAPAPKVAEAPRKPVAAAAGHHH